MKNSKKLFIVTQAILGAVIVVLVCLMFMENNESRGDKVSVVVPNSNDSRWAAFKYGLKRAAEDQEVELSIVSSTEEVLTVEEEKRILEEEIENGADALIVQPPIGEGAEQMLKEIEHKVPVLLVESTLWEKEERSAFPFVKPDNYALGKSLAEELLKDYNGNVEGKTFGIFWESGESEAAAKRKEGFCDALDDAAEGIVWTASSASEENGRTISDMLSVDFVIALDDSSFTEAGAASAARNLHGALVYGIGNSMEAVYYLDTRAAECLVVPDEFGMGYQSLTEVADNFTFHLTGMRNQNVSSDVLRRETLFSKENQELIFTMSQ